MIKNILSKFFYLLPFNLRVKIKHSFNIPMMEWSLHNLKINGFNPKNILDIGAYEGEWTKMIKKIYPNCNVLMVEPLPDKKVKLNELCKIFNGSVNFLSTLLSSKDDQLLNFHPNETASSVLDEHNKNSDNNILLRTKTVDSIANGQIFDLIKLDTQGFEIEILKGADKTIINTEVILMEISLIDIHRNVPLIKDVLDFMDSYDFQLYDICSFIRRPLDRALWQIDGIFVKKQSELVKSKRWI